MNTLFLPLPKKTKVHLDPASGEIPLPVWRNYRAKLQSQLAALLHTDMSHILLGGTASRVLYLYLNEENKNNERPLRVGITAYNCITLIQAIMSAGCIPVFIDTDLSFQIRPESISYMAKEGCSFVIWPNFYGARKRSEVTAKSLQTAGIRIIADEAQAFPLELEIVRTFADHYAHIMLFTFGTSKPVAGNGGGGLYMPKPDPSFKRAHQIASSIRQQDHEYPKRLAGAVQERITWKYPRITRKFVLATDRGNDVVAFLERSSMTVSYTPITNMQARIAYRNMRRLAHPKTYKAQLRYQNKLRGAVTAIDPDSWDYLKDVEGVAAIIALKIPTKDRFDLFEILASKGIRATWYFLPLTMLPRCRSFPSEPTPNAYKIADSVTVVAFQWRHTARQKRKVIKALDQAMKSIRNNHSD